MNDDRRLRFATLFLTYRCTVKCAFCDYGPLLDTPPAPMGGSDWQGILESLAEAGCECVVMTGGDPTEHPDFEGILASVSRLGLKSSLCVRRPLSDQVVSLLSDNPDPEISVGLDTLSPEASSFLHGDRVSLQGIIRMMNDCRTRGIRVAVSTVLCDGCEQDIAGLMRRCAEMDVSTITIACPRGSAHSDSLARYIRFGASMGISVVAKPGNPPSENSCVQCNVGRSRVILDPFGRMLMCDHPTHLRESWFATTPPPRFSRIAWDGHRAAFEIWLSGR
ncbi:MAG: radical SAM protein [Candidatus Brocadiia bacterium]